MFGDPRTYSASDMPVLSLHVTVEMENRVEEVVRDPLQDVTCDFVDGFAFGEAFGFGLRSVDGWWTVKNATLASDQDGVRATLLNHAYDFPSFILEHIVASSERNTHCAHSNTYSASAHRPIQTVSRKRTARKCDGRLRSFYHHYNLVPSYPPPFQVDFVKFQTD